MQQQAEDFGRSVTNALKEDRKSLYGSDLVRSLIFIALAAGLLFTYVRDKLNKQVVTIGLIAIVFIDLIGVDLRYLSKRNYVERDQFDDAFKTPTAADQQILADTSYYRVFNTQGDPFQSSEATSRTSYLHNNVGGYHPAKLALYNDLIIEQLSKGNMQVFNMLNTKYFIVSDPASRQPVVQQNPGALGPAWFVKAIKYVNNANEEMRALDNFNPKDTAIIDSREKTKITINPQGDSLARIELTQNGGDRMTYRSTSATDGFAVFSEVYYPRGWKAFIDGKETPIVKVNYVLRGLQVPAGDHTIEFRFEPSSYIIGNRITMIIGIISVLILLYGIFVLFRNYQRENKQPVVTK
jgi:hypothetical protein